MAKGGATSVPWPRRLKFPWPTRRGGLSRRGCARRAPVRGETGSGGTAKARERAVGWLRPYPGVEARASVARSSTSSSSSAGSWEVTQRLHPPSGSGNESSEGGAAPRASAVRLAVRTRFERAQLVAPRGDAVCRWKSSLWKQRSSRAQPGQRQGTEQQAEVSQRNVPVVPECEQVHDDESEPPGDQIRADART